MQKFFLFLAVEKKFLNAFWTFFFCWPLSSMRLLPLDLVFFILAFSMQIKDSTTRSKILRSPDASTHLYQRVRPSVRQPTCPSVDPSICSKRFICKSAFFYFWDWKGRQGSRRGRSLWQNFPKILNRILILKILIVHCRFWTFQFQWFFNFQDFFNFQHVSTARDFINFKSFSSLKMFSSFKSSLRFKNCFSFKNQ